MKTEDKNERLNKQISQIITLFGSDPNAVAMGMLDDVKYESTKAFMLDDIIEIVVDGLREEGYTVKISKTNDEPIKLYCAVADGFGGGHYFAVSTSPQQIAMRLNHPQPMHEDHTYFATEEEAKQYIANIVYPKPKASLQEIRERRNQE